MASIRPREDTRSGASKPGTPGLFCGSTERSTDTGEVMVVPHDVAAPEPVSRSSTAKAKASKTDRGTVERMDALKRARPDLAEKQVVPQRVGPPVKGCRFGGGLARLDGTSAVPSIEHTTLAEKQVVAHVAQQPDAGRDKTRQAKAKASKTDRGTVERMDRLMCGDMLATNGAGV